MGNVTNVAVAVQTKSSDKRYFRIGVSGQSNQGGKKNKVSASGNRCQYWISCVA